MAMRAPDPAGHAEVTDTSPPDAGHEDAKHVDERDSADKELTVFSQVSYESTRADVLSVTLATSAVSTPAISPSLLSSGRPVRTESSESDDKPKPDSSWSLRTLKLRERKDSKDSGDERRTLSTRSTFSIIHRRLTASRSSDGDIQHESTRSALSLGERVRAGSKDIDPTVQNIVSFDGCEQLLRGSPLSLILRKQARIFSDSGGSATTYALSRPTKIIDAFISHNWVVSRWHKWAVLLVQFNLKITWGLSIVVASPVGMIAACGWVPTVHPDFAPYPRSYTFRLIFFPIVMSVFCFYRELARWLPVPDPVVFLDKTCIHQEDRAIQRKGIEKLGAFLCYSNTMVICYTDTYLRKLWTVYEVASFMTLQSVDRIRVVPVMFPVVFWASLIFLWGASALALVPEIYLGFYFSGHLLCLFLAFFVLTVFRRWSRSKLDIHRTVSTFSARNCTCFCEDDRPLVYANIAALMRATQDIGEDASEDVALECFDNLVRKNLYGALITSVGKYSMRYEHAVAVGMGFVAVVFDQLVGFAHGMSLREFCNYALWYACITFFTVPTIIICLSSWAGLCLHIRGWKENVFVALGTLLTFTPPLITMLVLDLLEIWANESDLGIVVLVSFVVISSLTARNAMNGTPCTKVCGSHTGHAERFNGAQSEHWQNTEPSDLGMSERSQPPACETLGQTEAQRMVAESCKHGEPMNLEALETPRQPVCETIGKLEVKQRQELHIDMSDVDVQRRLQFGAGKEIGALATVECVNFSWGQHDNSCGRPAGNERDSRVCDDGCLLGYPKTLFVSGTCAAQAHLPHAC